MTRATERGFTLLEIAVALAILGVGIVTCLQVLSGSLRLQDRATRQTRAVLYARAELDTLLSEHDLEERRVVAPRDIEGYTVTSLVRRCGPEDGCDADHFDAAGDSEIPLIVQVDVSWQDGLGAKSYRLISMRMAQGD